MKQNIKIVVPLSESDIQDLMSGESFEWTFPSMDGKYSVDVLLKPEELEDLE